MMLVSMLEVVRYMVLMVVYLQISQAKWKQMPISLVGSCNFGFFAS